MQFVCETDQMNFDAPDDAVGLVCPICRRPLRPAFAGTDAEEPRNQLEWDGGTLDDLIEMLAAPAITARIEVVPMGSESAAGEVHLVAGGVHAAMWGAERGDPALDRLRHVRPARYVVEPRLPDPETGNIDQPVPDSGKIEDRPVARLMRYCEDFSLTASLEVWRGNENARVEYRKGEISRTIAGGIDAPERLSDVIHWTSGSYRIAVPHLALPTPETISAEKTAPREVRAPEAAAPTPAPDLPTIRNVVSPFSAAPTGATLMGIALPALTTGAVPAWTSAPGVPGTLLDAEGTLKGAPTMISPIATLQGTPSPIASLPTPQGPPPAEPAPAALGDAAAPEPAPQGAPATVAAYTPARTIFGMFAPAVPAPPTVVRPPPADAPPPEPAPPAAPAAASAPDAAASFAAPTADETRIAADGAGAVALTSTVPLGLRSPLADPGAIPRVTSEGLPVAIFDKPAPERPTEPSAPRSADLAAAAAGGASQASAGAPAAAAPPGRDTAKESRTGPRDRVLVSDVGSDVHGGRPRPTRPGFVAARPEVVLTRPPPTAAERRDAARKAVAPYRKKPTGGRARVGQRAARRDETPIWVWIGLGFFMGLLAVGAYWAAQHLPR